MKIEVKWGTFMLKIDHYHLISLHPMFTLKLEAKRYCFLKGKSGQKQNPSANIYSSTDGSKLKGGIGAGIFRSDWSISLGKRYPSKKPLSRMGASNRSS